MKQGIFVVCSAIKFNVHYSVTSEIVTISESGEKEPRYFLDVVLSSSMYTFFIVIQVKLSQCNKRNC